MNFPKREFINCSIQWTNSLFCKSLKVEDLFPQNKNASWEDHFMFVKSNNIQLLTELFAADFFRLNIFKRKDTSQNHISNFGIWPGHLWLLLAEVCGILSYGTAVLHPKCWHCIPHVASWSYTRCCHLLKNNAPELIFPYRRAGVRCAWSTSSWPPLRSEGNMRCKSSSLCGWSISQFVLKLEFSCFLVCSVSSCKDSIG